MVYTGCQDKKNDEKKDKANVEHHGLFPGEHDHDLTDIPRACNPAILPQLLDKSQIKSWEGGHRLMFSLQYILETLKVFIHFSLSSDWKHSSNGQQWYTLLPIQEE